MNDSVDSDTFLLSLLNSKILDQKYRDNKIGLLIRIQCPEANKKQAPIGNRRPTKQINPSNLISAACDLISVIQPCLEFSCIH